MAGVALILATFGESAAAIRSSEGLAESLREIDADSGPLMVASLVQAVGWMLLAVPLVLLFKAAAARASRVRTGLLGVVIIAPLFLAVGSVLGAIAVTEAASDFTRDGPAAIDRCAERKASLEQGGGKAGQEAGGAGDATRNDAKAGNGDARADGKAEPAANLIADCEEEVAREERTTTSVAGIETGVGLAGLLGFTIALVYTALWGLRTGLLTRFWGSLGIALGVVFSFFTLFTLAWFIYLGLLLAGWVPGGRPPAWAAGEARPWPKGGPLFGGDRDRGDQGDGVIDGQAEEMPSDESGTPTGIPEETGGADPGEAPRKRKKRDA